MSLDALINLQAKYNDQGRQGIQQLAKNIGGILQQKGIQDFERNAMDILRDGATPEKMEQISSMYPNMPKQEIWKFASEAGKRVDAQKLKDVFKNFQGWTQSLKQAGKSPTAKDVQAWMESQNLSQAQQGVVMQNFSKMVEFAKVGQPKRSMFNIGGQGAVQLENGVPVGETIGAPGPDVEMRTIYGPNNKTRRVPITKGKIYAPPEGWSENKPSEDATNGISVAQKETRKQNFIKNYGATKNKFDQIIEIRPKQRIHRLSGWFRTRELEKKTNYYTESELDQVEQAILTGLRVDPAVQNSISFAREQGATEEELRNLLTDYLVSLPTDDNLKKR